MAGSSSLPLGRRLPGPELPALRALVCRPEPGCADFLQGYAAAGGPPWLAEHMVHVVMDCEGSDWYAYPGPPVSAYHTRAQFEAGTWRTVTAASGVTAHDPWSTGYNVATWINIIGPENAGTTSGWPHCFWR